MILYSDNITPRLRFIAGFAGKEITGKEITITSSKTDFQAYQGAKINYSTGKITADDFWIQPHSLLFESAIIAPAIDCFEMNGRKAFFKTGGDFPFDVLAASFYLLTRYEEYLPHPTDAYGRYDYRESLAWKENFLDQPLVNCWLQELAKALQARFPSFPSNSTTFTFLPTYDIDMAWSYRHKGWWRNAGGLFTSVFNSIHRRYITERIRVLLGKQKDPFDAYGWMNGLHEKYNLKPYYFFLVAGQRSRYDKNVSPRKKAMQQLIYDHAIRYPIGIHPSWRSGDKPALLKTETGILSGITGSAIRSSRQHYIRFTLPETYRRLIRNGIRFDFSMGYGSINGFRAAVCSPFYWYDLEREEQTELMLFPFCFMDANACYEQGYSPQQALDEMRQYYQAVKQVNGMLIMIWHNNFLGTAKPFAGWREVYEQFVKEISS